MSQDPYKRAKKKVAERKDFYGHLAAYVIINCFLIAINLLTSPGKLWFIWPMFGWGIGLAFHAFNVFGLPGAGRLDEEWEARELEKELRQMGEHDADADPDDELELKEIKKERKDWDESDFV